MTTSVHKPKKEAVKKAAPVKKSAKKSTSSNEPRFKGISVGVRELRQSASQILDKVKDGLVIEITEYGVPVAHLVPITKSLYEEYLEAHRIIAARNPNRMFTMPKGKITKGKQLSEILIEERRAARF